MNRSFDLLWLRVREYFKHPAEDIRQANPIIPGRLYSSFGYIVKAVPLTEREKLFIKQSEGRGALPVELLRDLRPGKDIVQQLAQLQEIPGTELSTELPSRCNFCEFYHKGLPCPVYNVLKDGSTVCDSYKYVILKNQ
jgi:hypothetical protein